MTEMVTSLYRFLERPVLEVDSGNVDTMENIGVVRGHSEEGDNTVSRQ
jgi:hypothetical protein